MSSNRFFMLFLIAWPTLVSAVLTNRIVVSASALSLSEYVEWAFLAGAPVATYLLLVRTRDKESIAKVIYDAERGN